MKNSKTFKKVKVGSVTVTVRERVKKSGGVGYQVIYYDDSDRKFKSFSDKTVAVKEAEKIAASLSTHGARIAGTTPDQMAEYVRASDLLEPFKVMVGSGVERLAGWLKKYGTLDGINHVLDTGPVAGTVTPRMVAAAIQDFLADMKADGEHSELTVSDFDSRLPRLLAGYNCEVASVTTPLLQTTLNNSNGGAANYEHNRRTLSGFFGWCFRHGYHTENPAFTPKKNVQIPGKLYLFRRTPPPAKKRVFQPDEMRALLDHAPAEFVPMFLFCGFAGLRTSEFARLKWQDVDFANGRLIVGEDEGKTTASRRAQQLMENLKTALQRYKGKKGFVWTNRADNFETTFSRVCWAQRIVAKAAGMKWKQNALRHSYISYRLILKHSIADVAADAGNSPAIIHANYKSLRFDDGSFITEQAAREWFAIMPPATPATKPV